MEEVLMGLDYFLSGPTKNQFLKFGEKKNGSKEW